MSVPDGISQRPKGANRKAAGIPQEKDGSGEEGAGVGRVSADLGSWRPGFSETLGMTLDRLTLGSFSVNEEMGSGFHVAFVE